MNAGSIGKKQNECREYWKEAELMQGVLERSRMNVGSIGKKQNECREYWKEAE